MVNVGECASGTASLLHDVVCFFAATVAQAGSDTGLWGPASVVIAVVFHFLSHDGLLFVFEGVTTGVWTRLTGICCSMRALAPCLAVERPSSSPSPFADVQRNFIPKLDTRLKLLAGVELRPSISGVGFVSDVRAVTLADALCACWASAL